MLVAIRINLKDLFALLDVEGCLRSFAWAKATSLPTFVCVEIDPLDPVVFHHWVRDASDFDENLFPSDLNDREVFLGPLGGRALGDELAHRLAAAHNLTAAVFYHGNDIAAMSANKKFDHIGSPLFSFGAFSIRHRSHP